MSDYCTIQILYGELLLDPKDKRKLAKSEDLPEICFLDDSADVELLRDTCGREVLDVISGIPWAGEGSDNTALLTRVVSKLQGMAWILVVWEGGSDPQLYRVENGLMEHRSFREVIRVGIEKEELGDGWNEPQDPSD